MPSFFGLEIPPNNKPIMFRPDVATSVVLGAEHASSDLERPLVLKKGVFARTEWDDGSCVYSISLVI